MGNSRTQGIFEAWWSLRGLRLDVRDPSGIITTGWRGPAVAGCTP